MQERSSHEVLSSSSKTRTSKACDQCRKRKSKCGGEQPRCLVCETLERHCTYNINIRKRGLQPGYVRGLEIVLGAVFHQFPDSDAQVRGILRSHSNKTNPLDSNQAEVFASRWRKSEASRRLAKLLEPSLQQESEISDQNAQTEVPAPTAETHDESLDNLAIDDNIEFPSLSGTARTDNPVKSSRPFGSSQKEDDLLQWDLPQSSADLVEIYINNTHCWFPIIEQSDLLKSIHVPLTESSRAYDHDSSKRLCLWTVLAFVLLDTSSTFPKLHLKMVETSVQTAIIEAGQNFEIGHVQALLIIVLSKMALNESRAAWVLSAQASRMAVSYAGRQNRDEGRFNRTVRGCEMLDVLLSALHCDTSCWSRRNLHLFTHPLDSNSMDEWRSWAPELLDRRSNESTTQRQPLRGLSVFNYTCELFRKVHLLSHHFDGVGQMAGFVQTLQQWRDNLPQYCQLSMSEKRSQPVLCLHMSWHFAVCSVWIETHTQDSHLLSIVMTSVSSTISLAIQYVEMVGLAGSSPLLICYVKQSSKCIEKLEEISLSTIEPQLKRECNNMLLKLQEVAERRRSATKTIQNSRNAHTVHQSPLDLAGLQRETLINDGNQQIPHIQHAFEPLINGEISASSAVSSEQIETYNRVMQPFDGLNDLNMDFSEISPVLPIERPDQMTLLAQDLGFLDDGFSNEWLENL